MKKILLIILDGLGINSSEYGNAVKQAETPNLDRLMSEFAVAELVASGEEVGLPKGQMGNSEVGHMTIGSGRTIKQPLTIINEKIKSKEIFSDETLNSVMDHVNENNSTLHLIGLISNGGVHSSANHFYAALALAKLKKVKKVVFHFITDGRDTDPRSGLKFISDFMEKAEKMNLGKIGTISGRYYAMDRDNKWERTKKAYNAIVYGIANQFKTFDSCIKEHYKRDITDEFINPSIIGEVKTINNNDGILLINFRPERMTQLIETLTTNNFKMFKTKKLENVKIVSIFNLHKKVKSAYELKDPKNTFGEYIDSLDFTQARIAETEKYPHVTYFFDGGNDFSAKNCSKFFIESPKVATYDLTPEMSLGEVTQTAMKALEDDYDFILVNFANPDMVGHTGNMKATIDAIEICDFCLGKLYEKATEHFYDLVITADHGNSEQMMDKEGNPITSHTTNKVPFILCNKDYKLKNDGSLKDIVPTIIDIYEIKKPDEMTGESLIINE